jgi:hypothetical protein
MIEHDQHRHCLSWRVDLPLITALRNRQQAQWCQDNIGVPGRDWAMARAGSSTWYFEHEAGAVAFELAWGGQDTSWVQPQPPW